MRPGRRQGGGTRPHRGEATGDQVGIPDLTGATKGQQMTGTQIRPAAAPRPAEPQTPASQEDPVTRHHALRRPGRLAALALVAGAAALAGYSAAAPAASARTASPASATAPHPQELRDVRYCEVIPSVQVGSTVTTYVYNTLGYNNCPRGKWNKLTEQEVNQEFGSQQAVLNGPRHFVIDYAQATSSASNGSTTFTFGGIQTGLRATLTTQAGQPTVGQQAYVPNQVARDTIFTFLAGRPIFELTAPDGHVYVMQSYSQIVDPTLAYRDLPGLGNVLKLPAGWSYTSKTLTQTLQLNSNGLAYVVNDNLGDSYQRMS
jgi:hypothetical protein